MYTYEGPVDEFILTLPACEEVASEGAMQQDVVSVHASACMTGVLVEMWCWPCSVR